MKQQNTIKKKLQDTIKGKHATLKLSRSMKETSFNKKSRT